MTPFSSTTAPQEAPHPLRLLCIGDSITQGGRADREEFTYRLPLQESLAERGVKFEFVGSRKHGVDREAVWPRVGDRAFDPHHEGYYGARTTEVLEIVKAVLTGLPVPDVALVHLGTNDQNSPNHRETLVTPLEDLISILRDRNPLVSVFLGHLNFYGGPALKMRPLVDDLAARSDSPNSRVVTVAHYQGWNEHPEDPATDTYDWVHPNPRGQRKMADAWLNAMRAVLPAMVAAEAGELRMQRFGRLRSERGVDLA